MFTKKQKQGIEGMIAIIDKTVDELLEQGIIEVAAGDRCSPVLLVKKKRLAYEISCRL